MLYAKYQFIKNLELEQFYLKNMLKKIPNRRVFRHVVNNKHYYYYYTTDTKGKRHQKNTTREEYIRQQEVQWARDRLEAVNRELALQKKDFGPGSYKEMVREFQQIQQLPQPPVLKQDFHPDKLIYTTLKGDKVRSKSEAIIADALFNNNIPYSYEKPLVLNPRFRPDFTIESNLHGFPIYWEHCGLMNDLRYVKNYLEKKEYYRSLDIIENQNLIVTFEFFDNSSASIIPFDPKKVQEIINAWFLPPAH